MTDKKDKSSDEEERKPIIIRNTTDLQRLKLEKLMKNPDKPVLIPEKPKEKGVPNVPDFVRNVMGSSAGAGSGEFHVYRHLRRKEYARQKYMHEKGERERLDDEYRNKLEENKKLADEKTAKKRAKRQKKKKNAKKNAKKPKIENKTSSSEDSESEKEEENDPSVDNKDETNKSDSIISENQEPSIDNEKNNVLELGDGKESTINDNSNNSVESSVETIG